MREYCNGTGMDVLVDMDVVVVVVIDPLDDTKLVTQRGCIMFMRVWSLCHLTGDHNHCHNKNRQESHSNGLFSHNNGTFQHNYYALFSHNYDLFVYYVIIGLSSLGVIRCNGLVVVITGCIALWCVTWLTNYPVITVLPCV